MTNIRSAALTDIGQVRSKNEDAFLVDDALGLYAIADGMGGHQAGEVASRLALETLRSELQKVSQWPDDGAPLGQAILTANDRVFQESLARGLIQGMGTTLTAVLAANQQGKLWLGHVGDSRCYRLSQNKLTRLTRDHSWVQMQVDVGVISEAEAAKHPMRNVVTRSIGFEPQIEVDLQIAQVEPGDILLMATDGLTGKIGDSEIAKILPTLLQKGNLDSSLAQLIAMANERGGEDNITAILLQF